tara:strand:+ start:118 stop:222 length:105 start_codon:yes stop_codon:yes gene_type:complete
MKKFFNADIAQLVERKFSKLKVMSSNLIVGLIII